ncbi:MAG TPA: PA14 domain-containing protein, partial [Planctomycetota bacterium]|nr:PA14 domain-containing protein [Planctomycetota bacterium]
MGQEILYCYKCQTRLLGSEFEKGKAFKVGGKASCGVCVKELLASVPEAATESDRGRKLQSTARIPVQASESGSGKHKPATVRATAPPPPPPAKKTGLLIGGILGVVAILILLGIAMSAGSSAHRTGPASPAPAPVPSPPPLGSPPSAAPLPSSAGFASELREIDEKMRVVLAGEDYKPAASLLEDARKRRTSPEWLSEIDLRVAQIEGRVRRAALPLREQAIEAQKNKNSGLLKSLRERVAAWGFPTVVEDFDRALAEAAAPPAPGPAPAPATPVDPNAPPFVVYGDAPGSGVLNHSWNARIDLASTKQVYAGSRSIAVTLTKPWGALYLYLLNHVDATRYPYVAFSLLVNQDSPILSMTMWGASKGKSELLGFDKLGGLPKVGEWKRYVLPVAPFDVEGNQVHSIIFQGGRVTTEPLFFVDEIVFLPTAEDKAAPPSARPPVPALDPASAKWAAAAQKAAARDYDGAQKDLVDAADLELVKLAAQVPAEAAKVLEKWSKGQKVRLEYAGPGGEHLAAEGTVAGADAVRISIAREDGIVDVPVSEILPSALAELFRTRPERKSQDARAAAAFCAFEGDVDGVKKFSGENAALPEKYLAFAQSRSAGPDAEAAARRVFWAAEGEFSIPKRRIAATEKYVSLQSASELARLRPYIAARLEAAKETLLLAEDLTGTGTFGMAGNAKVELFWTSASDSAPGKAKDNVIDAEFYAFPGTPMKAWVWAGGCCQETFDASWQATDLTVANPKIGKEALPCEPGGDAALSLKIGLSLRKWHAQHGGPKEPARWEWVPLALPKYETAGPKKIRVLTTQQGFSVAAILVSATRRDPPRDAEMKEVEKARAAGRKAGGNEPPGTILHEYWLGIDGNAVDDLVKSPQFHGKPSGSSMRDLFEAPRNLADRFGSRMRGFIHPPVTGTYTFWIASDDGSELFLST